MRSPIRALAATAIVAGCAIASAAHAGTSPRQINLRLSELPAGFTQSTDRQYAVPQGDLNPYEQLIVSEDIFYRKGPRNEQLITSAVALYATAAFAQADYLHDIAAQPSKARPVSFPTVGVQHNAASLALTGGHDPLMGDGVRFWRGRYGVEMTVAGRTGTVGVQDLVRLARLVDRRIQAAG